MEMIQDKERAVNSAVRKMIRMVKEQDPVRVLVLRRPIMKVEADKSSLKQYERFPGQCPWVMTQKGQQDPP